jgi:hypothetical protein
MAGPYLLIVGVIRAGTESLLKYRHYVSTKENACFSEKELANGFFLPIRCQSRMIEG